MQTAVKWMRRVGFWEGVSFLLLLGVAMPLKYALGWPTGVEWMGPIHGGLWVLLVVCTAWGWARGLPGGLAGWTLVASVLPGGPFVVDPKLKRAVEQGLPGETPGSGTQAEGA